MPDDRGIVVVAAHPDDETIGAGIRLSRWNPTYLTIVHVTDGAPRWVADREAYARARREELYEALALAGVSRERCRELGAIDQEAHIDLPGLVRQLQAIFDEIQPAEVYTHPYEGGHPDHDSAAFAVAQAVQERRIRHREFTSYHAGPAGVVSGEFLESGRAVEIDESKIEDQRLKQRMYYCFRTQQHVLQNYPIVAEKFRDAPNYDFSQPPHPGPLHYETLGWDITGRDWRARVREVLELQFRMSKA